MTDRSYIRKFRSFGIVLRKRQDFVGIDTVGLSARRTYEVREMRIGAERKLLQYFFVLEQFTRPRTDRFMNMRAYKSGCLSAMPLT